MKKIIFGMNIGVLYLIVSPLSHAEPLVEHGSQANSAHHQTLGVNPHAHPAITIDQLRSKIRRSVHTLQQRTPQAKLSWHSSQLSPRLILGIQSIFTGDQPAQRIKNFMNRYQNFWYGVDLEIKELTQRKGRYTAHILGYIQQKEIFNQDAKVSMTEEGKIVNLVNGIDAVYSVTSAKINTQQAQIAALKHMKLPLDQFTIVKQGFIVHTGEAIEVFDIDVHSIPLQSHYVVRVNGSDASILSVQNRVRR
jgi:hypothetical protein